jgi:predicted ArsR family transcriptional regulator
VSLPGVAERFGRRVGAEALAQAGRRPSAKRRAEALNQVLDACGYQPYEEEGELRLRNCPFHGLAQRHRELVCTMNRSLLEGVLSALGALGLEATPDPRPSGCCVTIAPARPGTAR